MGNTCVSWELMYKTVVHVIWDMNCEWRASNIAGKNRYEDCDSSSTWSEGSVLKGCNKRASILDVTQ